MTDAESLQKAFRDGLEGCAYTGEWFASKDDDELAMNRRGMQERARLEKERRELEVKAEFGDGPDNQHQGKTEPPEMRPPVPLSLDQATRLLASLAARDMRPKVIEPAWKDFYAWFYRWGYQLAFAGRSTDWADVDRMAKLGGYGREAKRIAEMAVVDGYTVASWLIVRRSGVSRREAIAEAAATGAGDIFTHGYETGLAGCLLMPIAGISNPEEAKGYRYGCARRLDPALQ